MADVITRLKVESSQYDAKIKRATASLNEMTTAAEKEGNKIATANKENLALAQSLGKMATVSTTARGKMGELSSAIESATLMYNRLSAAEKQGQFGKALNASITQLKGRLKDLQGEMAAVNKQMGSLNKGGGLGGILGKGGGLSGMMGSFGGGMGSAVSSLGPYAIGAAAAAAAIGGLKKVMGDYLSINREFEQANANLAAVLGKTRGEIEQLTEDAKKYGASTMFTASQVTDLQTNLAKLGFTMGEIKNSTKAVLDLSAATGYDLAESASVAGAALRSFGLSAAEMDRVTSVLGVSTSKSALDMEKLSVAMPIVGSAASAMGFSIEDTVALLGKLTDTGMDASTAATALRNIFLKLADPSSKMSQAIGGNIRSLDDLVPALQKCKDEGMDLGEMFQIAKERGTVAFNTLVNGAEDVKRLRDELNDCGDAMRQMVDTQMNTLEGASKELDSAWEGLMLSFKSSNGILAETKRALADLLSAWTRWNNRKAGGEAAIGTYTNDLTDDQKKRLQSNIDKQRRAGKSDAEIKKYSETWVQQYDKQDKQLTELLTRADKVYKGAGWGSPEGQKVQAELQEALGSNGAGYELVKQLPKKIAEIRDKRATHEYTLTMLDDTPVPEPAPTTSGSSGGKSKTTKSNTGRGKGPTNNAEAEARKKLQLQKAQLEEEEKQQIAALDQMAMSQEEYEQKVYDIKHDTLEKIAGLYKDQTQEKADANARIYDLEIQHNQKMAAAARKAAEERAKAEKKAAEEAEKRRAGAGEFSEESISKRLIAQQDILKDAAIGSQEHLIAAEKIVDLTTLQNLLKKAFENGIDIAPQDIIPILNQIDGEIFLDPNVSNEDFQTLADDINKQLKEKGADIFKINFETGNLEDVKVEVKTAFEEMKESLDNIGSGVGAISTIGNAFDNIKGSVEDLQEAFSGEMDAWDALMTVFNSGISIMQTVMGVMEAINTLKELSAALSEKRAIAEATEATATTTAASTEVAAESEKMAASSAATATNTAEAASGAGKAMSAIPIVGPILAVAAIAAVLAAIMSAKSKAKDAGKFASGGLIGGNSFSGDNLTANVNSGELILNRAQQSNIAGQLNSNPMGNLRLSTEISGSNLRVVLNNDNRQRGGSRDVYGVH